MRIIRQPKREVFTYYERAFRHPTDATLPRYHLPCDAAGLLDLMRLRGLGRGRLVQQGYRLVPGVEVGFQNSYWAPRVGRCACGAELELYGDTACACGRLYNCFGQELAPPYQWEEDYTDDLDP